MDGNLQILNPGDKNVLLTLILVELLCAEICVLDLMICLLKELCNHVFDGLFHMKERIKPGFVRQRSEPRCKRSVCLQKSRVAHLVNR